MASTLVDSVRTGAVTSDRADPILPVPLTDPASLWDFGVHGLPLSQYLKWADDLDVFVAMADAAVVTVDDLVTRTPLSARGAEAFLGILCSVKLVSRGPAGYALCAVGREYLDRRTPYYLGPSLYGMLQAPLPPQLCRGGSVRRYSEFTGTLRDAWRYLRKSNQFGRREQLAAQHRRNLPVNLIAAHSGRFDGIQHLVDVGGGSGAFAIPLARLYPHLRITLLELPRALPNIRPFLAPYHLEKRVELLGCNAHQRPWPVEGCDGVLFGNILHFCDDAECLDLLEEAHRCLPMGGRVFIHEMLWNDNEDGPLLTALWNFWMCTICSGRQRSCDETSALVRTAGFQTVSADATAGGFTLIVAAKNNSL